MFSEFFLKSGPTTVLVAWVGLLIVVFYSMLMAIVKSAINDFYSDFYDLMQVSGSFTSDYESGSGELSDYRAQVWDKLVDFAFIVAPLVVASPASKWARSAWAFAWRVALMKSYLKVWDTSNAPIEGASQRLHEDTQRFSTALQGCLSTVLDAIFTLCVFTPILIDLSDEVQPPALLGTLRCAWLWLLALAASFIGLGGAALFGQKLVGLEVNNQKVEATLRKDLVLLESAPSVIVGVPCDPVELSQPTTTRPPQTNAPSLHFVPTLKRLGQNYHALFRHFSLLNLWLSFFDQVMVIMPYALAAPLLFADDPAARITLGTLVKMSNSFDKVFGSLSVISENWGAVNEFRSVLRRLREFESELYVNQPRTAAGALRLLPPPPHRSDSVWVDDDALGGCTITSLNTELVVMEGSPMRMQTTYGGARARAPPTDAQDEMHV